jgi:hypothetical protein
MLRPRVITGRDAAIIAANESPEALANKAANPPATGSGIEDSYFKKLLTYIPGETLAAYVVTAGMTFKAGDLAEWWVILLVSAFFTTFTFLWVLFGASDKERELPRPYYQASVSTMAFVIWALVLYGDKLIGAGWHPLYGSLLGLGLTMAVPLGDRIFVRAKPQPASAQ